ncbi:MAG TPA: hypothetical protein VNT75_13120 [Symbiobacteriaceae bacterium]|nr:hypothetical protein [Symbiobacteriaceae bacterium]
MHPYVDKKALDEYIRAIRSNDLIGQMRIITESIERSVGAEKAYWLQRRAACRMHITGNGEYSGQNRADFEEAFRLVPDDLQGQLFGYLNRAFSLQQAAPLGEIPHALRVRIWKEGLWHRYSFWLMAGDFHWLRRRWYQAFRAYTRSMEKLAIMTEEEYRRYEGWYYVLYSNRARAGLRCGHAGRVADDLQKAEAMTPNRPHLHPWYLAMAKGEWALVRGEYADALGAINACLARLVEVPTMMTLDTQRIELDLLAARIARAQGNQVGFDSFCAKALNLCLEKRLPMSEAHVRAVMAGEPF